MNIRTIMCQTALLTAMSVMPVASALSQEEAVLKDLGTVIILQGYPCGKAVKADRQGEEDYIVTCETGDRYRVTIDATTDRVEVSKL